MDALQRMWSIVLDTEVSAQTDFFVAGGDSLAIAELEALLEDEFGLDVHGADLLSNSTLPAFHRHLKAMGASREA